MKEELNLFLGTPPPCDRCSQDAAVQVFLSDERELNLCKKCVVSLIEKGLQDPPLPFDDPLEGQSHEGGYAF